jgi:hypothetical protein
MGKIKRMRWQGMLENDRQDLINLLGEHDINARCDRVMIPHLLHFDA